jgi:hypothetical protein
MSEQGERRSFWNRLFGGSRNSSAREERVLQYIIHRVGDGAKLQDVVQEDYVRRNATSDEVKEICSNPRLVASARESLERDFSSGDLDPNQRSS